MAYGNLVDNPLYMTLANSILGHKSWVDGEFKSAVASSNALRETCLGCHGTRIEVRGMKTIDTDLLGEIQVPDLAGWPNVGVGRINPDGSFGSCTACHPRHSFSIEIARKPYTCAQCHVEPDTPAWNVYKESKHGNICLSKKGEWNFDNVPWVLGEDFSAPTCSVCHNSLLTNPFDDAIEKRWALQWLFYANSIKYSSAMTGAPDYATFKNGWWELSRNLEEMKEILDLKKSAK